MSSRRKTKNRRDRRTFVKAYRDILDSHEYAALRETRAPSNDWKIEISGSDSRPKHHDPLSYGSESRPYSAVFGQVTVPNRDPFIDLPVLNRESVMESPKETMLVNTGFLGLATRKRSGPPTRKLYVEALLLPVNTPAIHLAELRADRALSTLLREHR